MNDYRLTNHVRRQAAAKSIPLDVLWAAVTNPSVRYESRRKAGQWRHIRDGVVAIVAEDGCTVVTCYADVVETDVRPDQTDADAQAFARRRSA